MRLLWMVLLSIAAGPAWAQTVAVRSGDHPDFTRVTFSLPARTEWRLVQDGPRVILGFPGSSLTFSTRTLFSRITRDRLASLSSTGDAVILELACDCNATAFATGDDLLVIDIFDPEPQAQASEWFAPPVLTDLAYRFPALAPVPLEILSTEPAEPVAAPQRIFPGTDLLPEVTVLPPDKVSTAIANLIQSQEILAQQIGRAATQGMLSLRAPLADEPAQSAGTSGADTAVEPSGDMQEESPADQISLSAATGIDIALSSLSAALPLQPGSVRCYPDDWVALNEWGSTDFQKDVAAWRRDLFGEFDSLSAPAQRGLARTYLHYGFGREAREVLSLGQNSDNHANLLRDMSHILDGETAPGTSGLAGMAHCQGDVAMWAILSGGGGDDQLPAAIPAIERAFARLPQSLKPLLAVSLAQRLTQLGAQDAAESLLLSLERGRPFGEEDALRSRIALADLTGATEDADDARLELALAEVPQSPQALVELIANAWRDGVPPTAEVVELAASYATEMRRSPIGPDMRLSRVRALALIQDFDGASALLDEIGRRDGPGAMQSAHVDLLTRVATHGSDTDLVRFGLALSGSLIAALDPGTGNRMADRFLDLGFPRAADALLEPAVRAPHMTNRRILRARAALEQGFDERALVQLEGIEEPDADILRARILEEAGDLAAAARIYRRLGQEEDASRLDWLAGLAGEDAQQGPLPVLRLPEPEAAAGELSQARSLLDSSQTARARIAAFLEAQADTSE